MGLDSGLWVSGLGDTLGKLTWVRSRYTFENSFRLSLKAAVSDQRQVPGPNQAESASKARVAERKQECQQLSCRRQATLLGYNPLRVLLAGIDSGLLVEYLSMLRLQPKGDSRSKAECARLEMWKEHWW